jgi:dipeptidyl aminopeptidase/acylaminoacyl peptidase
MPNALTLDLLWRLDRIGAVAASPDGRQAVCTVTRPDLANNRSSTALWCFDADGRRMPRQLTTAPGRPTQPAWSPRGDRIAFLARRDQDGHTDATAQLYLIAADGGEAVRASSFAPGIEAFRWLPDGKGVLFSAWVWPDVRGHRAQTNRWKAWSARKETGYATSEAQYRHWDHNHPMGRVLHLHRLDLASGRCTDLFEGTAWELPRDATSPEPFDASPDGRHVAFACDVAADKINTHPLAVVELDLVTRKTRHLASDPSWSFELPRYAPDGSRLAMLAAETGHLHTMPLRPALVERLDGKPHWRALGLQWDHEASSAPHWSGDGQAVYLTAESRGTCPLWRCDLDVPDGRFTVHTAGGWVQDFGIAGTPGGDLVWTVADAQRHPPQLSVQTADSPARRRDCFNDRLLSTVALGRHEMVMLRGAGGDPVQMWLTYPPGFNPRRRHPVLHVIHGGPYAAAGDTWSWRWNAQLLASQGHVVAQVNYHGSSGFGHAFKHSIMGRLATLEHADIEAATDWLLQQRWTDPRRVYASGGSYGGFLVAWLNGHAAPGRYRAHVCHAGVFDRVATFAADSYASRHQDLGHWYWDDLAAVHAQSPHAHAARMHTPTLVIHGALDYRVPDCNGLAYYNTLKARGVDARLLWFPDEHHWVLKPCNARQWTVEFFAWLQRHGGLSIAQRSTSPDSARKPL